MTQTTAYTWRPRTTFKIDPQVAGEELDKIRGHNSGDLTPDAVLTAAEPKTSPLHPLFEWDNSKAAHEYRLQQANSLIRAIVVTVSSGTNKSSEPLKVSVKRGAAGSASTTAKVIPPEELQRQRVERGWTELANWRSTYGDLPEFAAFGAMVDGLVAMRAKEKAAA